MPSHKGLTIPGYNETADGPKAFQDLVDSGPIPRFASSGARNTAITAPAAGMVAYLIDQQLFTAYDGTAWVPLIGPAGAKPGIIEMYAGTAAPSGYVFCDGAAYGTGTYPALFAVIGYAYGGSGGTFNVPDFRARHPLGHGAPGGGLTTRTRGEKIGAETLSQAQLPVGSTGGQSEGHYHAPGGGGSFVINGGAGGYSLGGGGPFNATSFTSVALNSNSGDHTHSLGGSGQGHTHPSTVVHFIIKV